MKLRLLPLLLVLCSLPTLAQSIAPQQFADLGDFKLESGAVIRQCRLGYRTLGTLNSDRSNAVLFPTWFTGTSENLIETVSSTRVIDPAKYYVVLVDAIGNGVSTSPSNSEAQPRTQFPDFTIGDMVNAEHRLLTGTLHLDHIKAVMGISMGGMQTFQWTVSYPEFFDYAVPIVGTPRQSSYDLLLWNSEADALEADPDWRGGNYTTAPRLPMVALLHNMHLTTPKYRVEHTSVDEFPKFFAGIESKGIEHDANNWLWQTRAMLRLDVARGGKLEDAARLVKAKTLVISAAQDHMVDPVPALEFARMTGGETLVLTSDCGHLAPGCEADKVSRAIDRFLSGK